MDSGVDLGAPIMGVETNDELIYGSPIPGSPTFNSDSNAIRIDSNIWDRYQVIQDLVE